MVDAPEPPGASEVRRLCHGVLAREGADDGHLAVSFVDEDAIAQLNERWRGVSGPTDVLSFPVDGMSADTVGDRELGDVVICAARCSDVAEAVVHGVLHLLGYDHEVDDGEMLARQDDLMAELRP